MFSRSGRGLLCLSWRLLLAGLRSKKFLAFIDGCRDGVYEYDESIVAEVRLLILEG